MKIIHDKAESIKINDAQIINDVTSIEYIPRPTGIIKSYSQRDSLWRNDLMVNSTIGAVGCAMTCCAMLGSQFDSTVTPKTLNQYLRKNNGYTNDNCIYWSKVSEFIPQLKYKNYYTWRDKPADIDFILNELSKRPVIIQVDFYPGGNLNTHFVLATSYTEGDITIIDAWDGVETKLLQRYALTDWSLARAIYAMVTYEY